MRMGLSSDQHPAMTSLVSHQPFLSKVSLEGGELVRYCWKSLGVLADGGLSPSQECLGLRKSQGNRRPGLIVDLSLPPAALFVNKPQALL